MRLFRDMIGSWRDTASYSAPSSDDDGGSRTRDPLWCCRWRGLPTALLPKARHRGCSSVTAGRLRTMWSVATKALSSRWAAERSGSPSDLPRCARPRRGWRRFPEAFVHAVVFWTFGVGSSSPRRSLGDQAACAVAVFWSSNTAIWLAPPSSACCPAMSSQDTR